MAVIFSSFSSPLPALFKKLLFIYLVHNYFVVSEKPEPANTTKLNG